MTTSRSIRPRARRPAVAALIVALFAAAGASGGSQATASAQVLSADPNVAAAQIVSEPATTGRLAVRGFGVQSRVCALSP